MADRQTCGAEPGAEPGAHLARHLLGLIASLPAARRCWIGYSGGCDSTVLLDLAAGLRGRLAPTLAPTLAAVHIDHGLNPASSQWAEHCQARCAALGVPLVQRRVKVPAGSGQGPEAAARTARYAALAELLDPGDLLLTAHHRDDQAETLLLALLRGSGVRGLGAMRAVSPLGPGYLVRPLLPFPRADLLAYAQARGLAWVEDPSNLDLDLDRNWLRHRLMPLLAERWPAAGQTLARGAGHCAEAAGLVDRMAAEHGPRLAGQRPGTLTVTGLRGLDGPLCRAVLRHWIGALGLPPPDSKNLARVMDEALTARPDASPLVAWSGCEVRRYRDDLFALVPLPRSPVGLELDWRGPELDLPPGLGRLALVDAAGHPISPQAIDPAGLRVRFGVPGLNCRPAGGVHHRPLKHLYQEAGIPPWLRPYQPLVFAGERLFAVADLWVCEANFPVRLAWTAHPWTAGILPATGSPGVPPGV